MMFLLTHLRMDKGWSKAELARRSRMGAGDLGKIESGRVKPYDSQLKKIAKALGYTVKNASDLMKQIEVSILDESGKKITFIVE